MSKVDERQQVPVVGFFQPHVRPQWDGMAVDNKTGELVPDPLAVSMTKQSFKEECDVNTIVKRFEATQDVSLLNRARAQGLYVDLPDSIDLQTALNQVAQAEAAFMALPAHVRAEFGNDPVAFVEAFNDGSPENQQRMIDLGLATDNRPPTPAEQSGPKAGEATPATPPASNAEKPSA